MAMRDHVIKVLVTGEELELLRRRAGDVPLSRYCRRALFAGSLVDVPEYYSVKGTAPRKTESASKRDLCDDCARGRHLACKGKQCECRDALCMR
jgi:hypothetical protein